MTGGRRPFSGPEPWPWVVHDFMEGDTGRPPEYLVIVRRPPPSGVVVVDPHILPDPDAVCRFLRSILDPLGLIPTGWHRTTFGECMLSTSPPGVLECWVSILCPAVAPTVEDTERMAERVREWERIRAEDNERALWEYRRRFNIAVPSPPPTLRKEEGFF